MLERAANSELLEKNDASSGPAWERDGLDLPSRSELSPVPARSRLVVHTHPKSAGADRFRLVQIGLNNLQRARKLKTLLVTSPLPGDGKSTVALNLATLLAENGKVPVLLLEADVYRPVLVERLGLKFWPGLTESFKSGNDPMLAVRRISPLGFYLLPAGRPVEMGGSILQSNFASQFVKGPASTLFSWVLIDAPPSTPVAEILSIKAYADATLLVARAGKTPREGIDETIRNLGRDHIAGIVLTGIENLGRTYSKYYAYGKPAAQPRLRG